MITFTRDEAQKLLDTLAEAIDAQQWELDNHIKTYGEWYRPKRVEYMKDALANTLRTVELLSHKLNTPQEREPVIDNSMAKRIATQLGWEPKREWVGLTDEEINALHYELKCAAMGATSTLGMYRILERALREKNNG